jgi:hypothetical protein
MGKSATDLSLGNMARRGFCLEGEMTTVIWLRNDHVDRGVNGLKERGRTSYMMRQQQPQVPVGTVGSTSNFGLSTFESILLVLWKGSVSGCCGIMQRTLVIQNRRVFRLIVFLLERYSLA